MDVATQVVRGRILSNSTETNASGAGVQDVAH
jgi:hypothetical protein